MYKIIVNVLQTIGNYQLFSRGGQLLGNNDGVMVPLGSWLPVENQVISMHDTWKCLYFILVLMKG